MTPIQLGHEHFACRLRILVIFISASAQLSWVLLGFQRFSGSQKMRGLGEQWLIHHDSSTFA